MRSCTSWLAVATLAGSALVGAPALSATAPPGWTEPARIPGTAGQFNQVSATARDGADLVAWIDTGSTSGYQIRAKVRMPGRNDWQGVKARIDNRASIQDLVLTAGPDGDFWLAFSSYHGSFPSTGVTRLDTSRRRWTDPRQPFAKSGYHFLTTSLAVAGDGTVAVGAYARPDVYSSPPAYRAVVATLAPGARTWQQKFLSPANNHAGGALVGAGSDGHLAAAFIRGSDLSAMTVVGATRAPGAAARWRVADLSVAGDSQSVSAPAVGSDGSVAAVWTSSSTSPNTVRIGSTRATPAGRSWTVTDLQTAGGSSSSPSVVMAVPGEPTAVWRESTGGGVVLVQAKHVVGGVPGPLLTVSPPGVNADIRRVVARNDGSVALLTAEFTTGTPTNLGMHYTIITGDSVTTVATLTDGSEPNENQEGMGLTATDRPTIIFTRGYPPPDTDLAWFGRKLQRPRATPDAFTNRGVGLTTISGSPRVGSKVRCTTGFWVETSALGYSWWRGAHRIHGATHRAYRIVGADRHHQLSCRVTAVNDAGKVRLKGTPRPVP